MKYGYFALACDIEVTRRQVHEALKDLQDDWLLSD